MRKVIKKIQIKLHLFISLIGFGILFLTVSPLLCAATNQERSALIIGIGHYAGPASDLLGVPADVESAKTIAKAMGVSEQNITVIRDKDATKVNIIKALEAFSKKAADGGRVYIYFSGHGTRSFDSNVGGCVEGLLTYDYQSISNNEMAQATKSLNRTVDKSIFMIDACHSGGVLNAQQTRSLENSSFVAKFAPKDASGNQICAPSNYKTRGLFTETQRLGAIQENQVFITAAKPDEVSWDEGAGRGGSATQAVRDCLLGGAKDLNQSGAVSLEEVRKCAQDMMDQKMPGPVMRASHITISGNRNLIPVPSNPAVQEFSNVPAPTVVAVTPVVSAPQINKPAEPIVSSPGLVPIKPELQANKPNKPVQTVIEDQIQKPPAKPPVASPEVNIQVASLATLQDVEAQRNPQRIVDVKLTKSTLKINQDFLGLQIKSNHDGYLYLVLLGSDQKSFYILFPNRIDGNNQIKSGQTVTIPGESWRIKAAGPAGIDRILVMVSDSPRDLINSRALTVDQKSPYVFAINNLEGRTNLINYLTGKGESDSSEKYAAKIVSVTEK
jgi:hypothetical protein